MDAGASARLAQPLRPRPILSFPTSTRTYYQENYEDSTPVLTGDRWTNHVEIAGDDFARCAPPIRLCTGAGAEDLHRRG